VQSINSRGRFQPDIFDSDFERIFKPFFQLLQRAELGLAIYEPMIDAHARRPSACRGITREGGVLNCPITLWH
jgi:hypothetical protein